MKKSNNNGLTLIELLIVIAIISILAAIIYVSVNPAKRIAQSNNAQRWSEVTSVLNAVLNYTVDNGGSYPAVINSNENLGQVLGTNVSGCNSGCGAITTDTSCVNLEAALVDNGYIAAIPTDPVSGSAGFTDYYINREDTGAFVVGACDPQVETGTTAPEIRVSR